MSTRFIVPNGIGDGSSLAAAAPITDLNNQQNLAVGGAGDAEVWLISDLGSYDIPMSSPGVDSSSNQSVFTTINTQASSSSKKVKVCGRRQDGTPDHAVIQSQRIRPYARTTTTTGSTRAKRALEFRSDTSTSSSCLFGTWASAASTSTHQLRRRRGTPQSTSTTSSSTTSTSPPQGASGWPASSG